MQLRIYDPRVIAIDLRHRRCGFAIFEGPRVLLDFGTLALPGKDDNESKARLLGFLRLADPTMAVVKKERWESLEADPGIKPFAELIRRHFDSKDALIRLLAQDAVNTTFGNLGCTTKAEISAALARIFPELVWQLPPERKPWQSEHPRQSVFDAIALGLAYWQNETSQLAAVS